MKPSEIELSRRTGRSRVCYIAVVWFVCLRVLVCMLMLFSLILRSGVCGVTADREFGAQSHDVQSEGPQSQSQILL